MVAFEAAHRQAAMVRVLHRSGGELAFKREGWRGRKHKGSRED
jgi:hypothetical protein